MFLQVVSLIAICVVVEQSTCIESNNFRSDSQINVILHHSVRKMLGFGKIDLDLYKRKLIKNPDKLDPAPEYMMQLYKKFRFSWEKKGKHDGNTVRAVVAEMALLNGEKMFVFNLSALTNSKKIYGAEMHLFKRKRRDRTKMQDANMYLNEIAPDYITRVKSVRLNSNSYGWEMYDVTETVMSCLSPKRTTPAVLAANFAATKGNGKRGPVRLKRFMKHDSLPFIVIFSDEDQKVSLDHLDPRYKKEESAKSFEGENEELKAKRFYKRNVNARSKRSVDENLHNEGLKIPRRMIYGEKTNYKSLFHDPVVQDKKAMRRFKAKMIYSSVPENNILQGQVTHRILDTKMLPYPDWWKRKKRRRMRKHRKNRRKGKGGYLPWPTKADTWWDRKKLEKLKRHQSVVDNDANTGQCGVRQMILDFADIGWERFIIAPKRYEANYCAGSCPFPLSKKLSDSNHATIQSIVNAVGIYKNVPAPSCVPDKLTSLTLLYYDESRNVVLKNYPGMSVESCTCR